jgi:hypothetical protein
VGMIVLLLLVIVRVALRACYMDILFPPCEDHCLACHLCFPWLSCL